MKLTETCHSSTKKEPVDALLKRIKPNLKGLVAQCVLVTRIGSVFWIHSISNINVLVIVVRSTRILREKINRKHRIE